MSDVSRVEELFLNALGRSDPAARAAYLEEQCGPDADLRRRVEELLAAQPHAQGFLEPPTVDTTRDYVPTPDAQAVGTVIAGKYTLTEVIGEGGMGTVWRAKQTEPVKRFVALKLIKPGMDSKQVLARFDAERQALAMMDHPNIAKILDGGIHDNRPFFVMELVKGTPITEFCDVRKLTTQQRLELFLPVCQAIQHAHQKGIIHRDIKPSNVLIALYDDKPVPKVIDFGVAKATGGALTQHTIDTGFGGVVGTPQYMSPEQATFNNLDIDTRSDVYSLGTLLYELLAGSPPFARPELEKRGLLEILRVVREEEPPRPSIKLSTADAKASISANRSSEPAKLSALMKGEIDWIVMKALEKDRTRRYDTANGLAADVRRYLNGDAVEACPPTLGYRLKKAYRRNKTAVRVAGVFTLLMLAAVAVSSWLAVKATRAEAEAVVQAEAARSSAALANKQTRRAEMATADYRVDLDLAALATDARSGLLKLVGTRRYLSDLATVRDGDAPDAEFTTHMADRRDLATLVTVAVGQTFAPLLPPVWPDGTAELDGIDGPDGRTVLTRDAAGVVRLWDALAVRPVVTLRQRNERAVRCGFSPDGRTVFTQDDDSVVRFWTTDGVFRGKTPLRPDRYIYLSDQTLRDRGNYASNANSLIIGNRTAVLSSTQVVFPPAGGGWSAGLHGPDVLHDTTTGRPIARLDRPGYGLESVGFSPDGRLLTAVEWTRSADGQRNYSEPSHATVVVFAADSGQELARLTTPSNFEAVKVSPGGKWLLTKSYGSSHKWRLWDTGTWAEVQMPFLDWPETHLDFVNDDLLWRVSGDIDGTGFLDAVHRIGGPTLSIRQDMHTSLFPKATRGEGLLFYRGTELLDGRTLTRLPPPAGRRFHPRLAEAAGGRFLRLSLRFGDESLADTRTEKVFAYPGGAFTGWPAGGVIPGADLADRAGNTVRLLPKADRLAFPHDQLELWVQVAVRGELGPDGEFAPWDEPTWQRKWQQLAAAPMPFLDFPFPGHLARDPLHWLRKEYEAAAEKDKLHIVTELLRRAEASGDTNEAVRWRTERAKYVRELAPPPREKK